MAPVKRKAEPTPAPTISTKPKRPRLYRLRSSVSNFLRPRECNYSEEQKTGVSSDSATTTQPTSTPKPTPTIAQALALLNEDEAKGLLMTYAATHKPLSDAIFSIYNFKSTTVDSHASPSTSTGWLDTTLVSEPEPVSYEDSETNPSCQIIPGSEMVSEPDRISEEGAEAGYFQSVPLRDEFLAESPPEQDTHAPYFDGRRLELSFRFAASNAMRCG